MVETGKPGPKDMKLKPEEVKVQPEQKIQRPTDKEIEDSMERLYDMALSNVMNLRHSRSSTKLELVIGEVKRYSEGRTDFSRQMYFDNWTDDDFAKALKIFEKENASKSEVRIEKEEKKQVKEEVKPLKEKSKEEKIDELVAKFSTMLDDFFGSYHEGSSALVSVVEDILDQLAEQIGSSALEIDVRIEDEENGEYDEEIDENEPDTGRLVFLGVSLPIKMYDEGGYSFDTEKMSEAAIDLYIRKAMKSLLEQANSSAK